MEKCSSVETLYAKDISLFFFLFYSLLEQQKRLLRSDTKISQMHFDILSEKKTKETRQSAVRNAVKKPKLAYSIEKKVLTAKKNWSLHLPYRVITTRLFDKFLIM